MSVVCFISCASKHVLNYVVVGEWGLGGGGEAMGGGGGCRHGVQAWGAAMGGGGGVVGFALQIGLQGARNT